MVGKALHEFLHARPAAAALARYKEAEEAREPIEYETVIERPGVPRLEVVTHLTPLFDGDGHCYRIIGSARDVTDRRRAEAALLQAQKIESLGVLAGGIAHDFNNLLTTILGNLFLLDRELEPNSALKAYTNDARVASERGADLVKRMLGFSRPGMHAREEVSLDMLFGETASLVQRTLGPAVALVIEPAPAPDRTAGEFSALQQVIVNLLLNARDAMPEGGRIVLRRGLCEIAADQIWHQRGVEPGRFHEITIADQGVGMSRDLVQRIFDPFFTTKGVGKGTGLGLSTAFSIVRAQGGWLEVESKEGAGSTFRILLPAL
jgi:signal transduction histidine kinase